MIPAKFDYAAPTTVQEALGLLAEHGDEAKVLAGGQSLLPVLRMRLNAPEVVIDIGRIDSLRGISDDGSTISIGAMTPYHEILADERVRTRCTLLHQAISEVADSQIRHRGTLGGALVHADPAGDCGAPILAMDAELVITGSSGERVVAAADFFEGLFDTAVAEDELLTAIRVPAYDGWGSHYEKFVRVAHQWPIVAVAAQVRMEGGSIAEARIGLTNMGSTAVRASAVEAALVGTSPTAEGVRVACDLAGEGTDPPSDLNGDADYRKHLATVLTRRAVLAAAGRED
ncbi:MAG: xanthine dehydrogenase family protein subunit M [Janibacter sp.]|nr:xanthine dehydrogenase family protein subunit M [Janibacter sp.]